MLCYGENDQMAVEKICEILRNGGVAAVPTETVYGLVCCWDNPEAREKIYSLKRRPREKRLQMLAASVEDAVSAGLLPDTRLEQISRKFWPGALTVVAKANGEGVNGSSIGLRIPAHSFMSKLLKALGTVLAATSANLSSCPPGLDARSAVAGLDGEPDILIDGGSVRDIGGKPSTVVSLLGEEIVILREGPVSLQDIQQCLQI